MAFQKTLTLPSGVSGNYSRISSFTWDRSVREASAIFALYVDSAAASSGKAALVPVIAKLRVSGDKFTPYLGNSILAGDDILGQLYLAAKVEPVSCDFGDDVFVDAQDV